MKQILLFGLLGLYYVGFSQPTQFQKGFDYGFKRGYCYTNSIGCIPPIPPIAPIPNINEKSTNFEDGYNKGFLVGKGMSDNKSILSNTNNAPGYIEPPKPFSSSAYVSPLDLKLMAIVLSYKQKLFDTRAEWTYNRFNELAVINSALFETTDSSHYQAGVERLNFILLGLSRGVDFTNNTNFYYYVDLLAKTQSFIFSKIKN